MVYLPNQPKVKEIVYRVIFCINKGKLLYRLFPLIFTWFGIYTILGFWEILEMICVPRLHQRVKWNFWLGAQLEQGLAQIIFYGTSFLGMHRARVSRARSFPGSAVPGLGHSRARSFPGSVVPGLGHSRARPFPVPGIPGLVIHIVAIELINNGE